MKRFYFISTIILSLIVIFGVIAKGWNLGESLYVFTTYSLLILLIAFGKVSNDVANLKGLSSADKSAFFAAFTIMIFGLVLSLLFNFDVLESHTNFGTVIFRTGLTIVFTLALFIHINMRDRLMANEKQLADCPNCSHKFEVKND